MGAMLSAALAPLSPTPNLPPAAAQVPAVSVSSSSSSLSSSSSASDCPAGVATSRSLSSMASIARSVSLKSSPVRASPSKRSPAKLIKSARRRSWIMSFERSSIITFLQRAVQVGYLEVVDGRDTLSFGQPGSPNPVRVVVTHDNFWQRVFHCGDLGFSEAYMMGEAHCDDLKGVMDLWLDNESTMTEMSSALHRITSTLSGWSNAFFGQTLSRARLNAMASYDQSNDLFRAFLSQEMMYSCALWGPEEGGPRGDLDTQSVQSPTSSTGTLVAADAFSNGALEAAQARKIAHVLAALRLPRGGRLLEVGSGWGALAIAAAREFDAEVDTITLSVEQQHLAEERVRAAGLEGRIRVHLMDYREVPREWEGTFDAFVSVEMLEHVGTKHYTTYFAIVDRMLKKSHATAVVTSSTFPESRYTTHQAEDFMRRYMWPNSCLPSATVLVTAAQQGSHGRLALEGVENHAAHYPRTLREWGRRLEARLTPAALGLAGVGAPAPFVEKAARRHSLGGEKTPRASISATQRDGTLLQTLPAAPADDAFDALKRKWQYLFAYAGAGFCKGYISCHMLTFSRGADGA